MTSAPTRLKFVGRIDENFGDAALLVQIGHALKDARGGRPDRDKTLRRRRFLGEPGGNGKSFRVHLMVAHQLAFDRAERAKADMQGKKSVIQLREQPRSEMESRRRRGDRAFVPRIDGLVALVVIATGFPREQFALLQNIRGQRHGRDNVGIERRKKAEHPLAAFKGLEHLGFNRSLVAGESDAPPVRFFARFHQRDPMLRTGFLEEQNLDRAIDGRHRARPDFRVVQDNEVGRRKQSRQFMEGVMAYFPIGAIDTSNRDAVRSVAGAVAMSSGGKS